MFDMLGMEVGHNCEDHHVDSKVVISSEGLKSGMLQRLALSLDFTLVLDIALKALQGKFTECSICNCKIICKSCQGQVLSHTFTCCSYFIGVWCLLVNP